MLCWGSWGNTQKLASKSWRYEFFYWDYVIGLLLFSLLIGFTLGSIGEGGRSFCDDIAQVSCETFGWIIVGGIIFNLSNILLSASISLAGMSVAFPVGVGLALVLGVIQTYALQAKGNPVLLFLGVALVVVAIIVNGMASGRMQSGSKSGKKGILLAIVAGVLMSCFYFFVAKGMDLDNFENPAVGKATPYTAFFIFALGIFLSNFLWGTIAMKHPVEGEPVSYLNLTIDAIKNAVIQQLKAGHPVWFGSDCLKFSIRKDGVFDRNSAAVERLCNIKFDFSKGDRLTYGDSAMNHAMVILGVNLDKNGKPDRWRIENSWGKDAGGHDGYYVASDSWFDEFVYQVVVDKKYLTEEDRKLLKQPLIELEPWDPMGTLAD